MEPRVSNMTIMQIRNVLFLAVGWCMAVGSLFIIVSSGTAFAKDLKGNSMATIPIGVLVASATISSILAPFAMRILSMQVLFTIGSILGVGGGAGACFAVWRSSFEAFVIFTIPQGIAYGLSNLYRFYATDTVLPRHREKALAASVGGAVLSAFIGPEISRHVRGVLDPPYLGAFLLIVVLWTVQLLAVSLIDHSLPQRIAAYLRRKERKAQRAAEELEAKRTGRPPPSSQPGLAPMYTESTCMSPVHNEEPVAEDTARIDISNPLFHTPSVTTNDTFETSSLDANGDKTALTKPKLISRPPKKPPPPRGPLRPSALEVGSRGVLVTGAVVACMSFFIMAGIMAATPLVMSDNDFSVDQSTIVIEIHMVSMYLPSLFSGHLVSALGAHTMIAVGSTIIAAGVATLFAGRSLAIFMIGLGAIGVGWNFDYVAASSMVMVCLKEPMEKPAARATFDSFALTGLSVAIISSGFTYDGVGWDNMLRFYIVGCGILLTGSVLFAGVLCVRNPREKQLQQYNSPREAPRR